MSVRETTNEVRPIAANYSRFSSDLQNASSIAQQQVECRDAADRDGFQTPAEMEFSDAAVSGTVRQRAGLDALMAAAAAGLIRVVYFYSFSRLARELVILLPLLKELVEVHKVRVVSLVDNVDSQNANWELSAIFSGIQHGRFINELSASVFRGQAGNIRAGLSNGDYCFGYVGEPVPGSEQSRRGRNAHSRMTYAIDPVAAEWVKRIFHWFVVERQTIRWIARELTRLGAPKGHRSRGKSWHHQSVTRLLRNLKYTGLWNWGKLKNARNPLTGQISREERPSVEVEAHSRVLPELRIVDQEQFEGAQRLLHENQQRIAGRHRPDGKFSRLQKGQSRSAPRHLLADLIICGQCGHGFYVGGAHGKYLFCPNYGSGTCSCKTTLPRERAERLILQVVSNRLLDNPEWLADSLESARQAWRIKQESLPSELVATKKALAEVQDRIGNLLDHIERRGSDANVEQRRQERQAEEKSLKGKLTKLQASAGSLPQEPNAAWLKERIRDLTTTLHGAAPAAAFALRDLVGGKIVVEEVKVPGKKRHFLRGRFSFQGTSLASVGLPLEEAAEPLPVGEAIELDFVAENVLDAKAEEVKALWDKGMLNSVIAERLKCSRAQVTKLLQHWSKLHGVVLPDGRKRRAQLVNKNAKPALFQRIADQVMVLVNDNWLLGEIAEKLGCDPNVITKAIRYWHESRGLPIPDGRTRRRSLERKSSNGHADRGTGDKGPAAA